MEHLGNKVTFKRTEVETFNVNADEIVITLKEDARDDTALNYDEQPESRDDVFDPEDAEFLKQDDDQKK